MKLRLWPTNIRFAATCHTMWSQGGTWEDRSTRCLDRGFRVVFGFVWPVKKTYRGWAYQDTTYLILDDN